MCVNTLIRVERFLWMNCLYTDRYVNALIQAEPFLYTEIILNVNNCRLKLVNYKVMFFYQEKSYTTCCKEQHGFTQKEVQVEPAGSCLYLFTAPACLPLRQISTERRPTMSYSKDIFLAVKKNLEDSGVKHVSINDEKGMFTFTTHIDTGISFIHCIVDIHEDNFLVLSRIPVKPYGNEKDVKATIRALAEFVCRANYGLKNGCFELDLDDGELRFRTFVDCEELLPSQEVIFNSIGVSIAMVNRYSRGILDVLYKGADPKIAVQECEGKFDLPFEVPDELPLELLETSAEGSSGEEAEETGESSAESQDIPSYQHFLRMTDSMDEEADLEEGDDSESLFEEDEDSEDELGEDDDPEDELAEDDPDDELEEDDPDDEHAEAATA